MKTIYTVEGIVNQDFVGQISYTICLKETYHKMDIGFSFEPQHFTKTDLTPELEEKFTNEIMEKYGKIPGREKLREIILSDMKTEMHLLAMLNETFIGGIHRQLTERHMVYDGETATEGCLPTEKFEGVLKVIVLIFNVLKDATRYKLWIQAE